MSDDPDLAPLRRFVTEATALVDRDLPEAELLEALAPRLAELVAHDGWLPAELAAPDPVHYRQYLLHADPRERLSVVSFVWGPGQATPVHDHTVWGLIGMLRGAEAAQPYALDAQGVARAQGPALTLHPGQVERVSPTLGDIHRVWNVLPDQVSISIHVYGANIGAVQRSVYPAEGGRKRFVSGYSNRWVPNLWDRSVEIRQP